VNRRLFFILATFVAMLALVSAPVRADQFALWVDDASLGGVADKAKIAAYLDNLKARGVNGLWVQVESPAEGAVNYKKTTLSSLPTAGKFKTGRWADDDFLGYVISQAGRRGMKVIVKLQGGNQSAWDKNAGWRRRDSKGRAIPSKNFCPNSPYWDERFFPMLREIAANYDVDGFCLDTSQMAHGTYDSCFCAGCKARFEAETGKKLPLRPVDRAKWANPAAKLHAIKRVEWLNRLFERYAQEVEKAKPGAIALLNVSGGNDSYRDAISARHAGHYVAYATAVPADTPGKYAAAQNQARSKAHKPLLNEDALARDEVAVAMNRYGYYELLVKRALADGAGKPTIPIGQCWSANPAAWHMGPVALEIAQIELAIAAGAKGYCFSGPLAGALTGNKIAGTTWANPKFSAYLKDLAAGDRVRRGGWLADMRPDARVAILCDRDADFWAGDGSKLVNSVGALFAAIHYWRKTPMSVIFPSEPDQPGFGQSGYKLTGDALAQYDLVVAAGLDYVGKQDLQTLREYVDNGGRLLIMGPIGGHGKFLAQPITDDAYEILGITTIGGPEPSGYVLPAAQHPVFMVPEGFPGPMGSFRISEDKYDSLSYKPKFGEGWEVLANEVNDNGRRAAILMKEPEPDSTGKIRNIGYLNSDMVGGFSAQMLRILANMVVVTTGRSTSIVPLSFSETASVNTFKSPDGLTRYIHIFTLDGESNVEFRIRPDKGTFPVAAEIILGGGKPRPLQVTEASREPGPWEMTVSPSGNCLLKLSRIEPPFAIVKIKYEKRERKPAQGQG